MKRPSPGVRATEVLLPMKSPEELRSVFVQQAVNSYRRSDKARWISALWCSRVVGGYDRGATRGLADDMGVSVDTAEDLAHAYQIFEELCRLPGARYFVFTCRRSQWIYYSHFRALYDARKDYELTNEQVLSILMDIYQGEGQISSRNVSDHTREKYGKPKSWEYYARKVELDMQRLLDHPELPRAVKRIVKKPMLKLRKMGRHE